MRILFFIGSLGAGGTEKRLITLLKGLESVRHIRSELVVTSKNIHYNEVEDLNINIHFLLRKIKKDPTIYLKLFKVCKEFQPDIIHTWCPMSSVYAMPISNILGIKLIIISSKSPVPDPFLAEKVLIFLIPKREKF